MLRPILLISLAALAFPAVAQLSPEQEKKLDAVFAPWDKKDAPGGVVGVVKDGKLVYAKGFGMASLEHSVPNGPDSVIDIGSISKHFTSACLLLLQEEGKLNIDDDVRKYVPELPNFGQTITIRNILTHTSGLRDYFTLFALSGWNPAEELTQTRVLDMLKRQQDLNFPVGSSWNYCNTGYFLASLIVERLSGQPIKDYAQDRIFKPLGMTRTLFHQDNSEVIPGRVMSYSRIASGRYQALFASFELVGDGGVYTTINDFAKWDLNLFNNKLGKGNRDLFRQLTQTFKIGPNDTGYGLGLQLDALQGIKRIQHGGDWLGFNAQYSHYPDKGVSIMSFGNDGTQLGKSLNIAAARALFDLPDPAKAPAAETAGDPFAPTPAPVPEEEKAKISGSWLIAAPANLPLRIFEEQGRLMAQAQGQPALQLRRSVDGKYFLREAPILIEKSKEDDKGVWTEAIFKQKLPDGSVFQAALTRQAAFVVTDAALEAWVGTYYSSEMKTAARIYRSGKTIYFALGTQPPAPLSLLDAVKASAGGVTLDLATKAGQGKSIRLNAGRASGLRFDETKSRVK